MKSFFDLFKRSAASLSDIRTLTVTGILLAAAVAIRSLAIQVTPDLRITFAFLPMCIIAMLYGPVVSATATFALDLIGFLIDNKSARGYSPQLALVVMIAGVIYGCFLYRKEISITLIVIARTAVVLICNVCLNSYFVYSLYVNKEFSLFDPNGYNAFGVWILPRIIKNGIQLPIDLVLMCIVLPAAMIAYKRVFKKTSNAN